MTDDENKKAAELPETQKSTVTETVKGRENFFDELWSDAREPIHHALIFTLLLGLLSAFSFLIPRLPISDAHKQALKSFDLVLISIVILIYTTLFLFKTVTRIIERNPAIRRVGTWLLSLARSNEIGGPSDAEEPRVRSSRNVILNRISDLLIILTFALTVFFAVRGGEWLYSFSIPVAASLKGILILMYLPNEITSFALYSLLSVVTGLVILVTSLYYKKDFASSWGLAAFGLLGFGIGTALGTARLSSIYIPKRRQKGGRSKTKE
jgi:hypothetical protein